MDADDTRATLLHYGKTVLHITCSYAVHISVVVLALYLRVRGHTSALGAAGLLMSV